MIHTLTLVPPLLAYLLIRVGMSKIANKWVDLFDL
jgi:hypothetical protein